MPPNSASSPAKASARSLRCYLILNKKPLFRQRPKRCSLFLVNRSKRSARIKEIDAKLNAAHKAIEVSTRLATISGIGRVIALTLATEIEPSAFEHGRHLAAWVGLTPKEHFTGGKQRMGKISRAGNERLRALFVSGATSIINAAMKPGSRQMTEWLRALLLRKPRKPAAAALANKIARTAWAMMTGGETYR